MSKYILQSIENINWLAIMPLILFFVFFVVVTVRAILAKRTLMDQMSKLPLEEE